VVLVTLAVEEFDDTTDPLLLVTTDELEVALTGTTTTKSSSSAIVTLKVSLLAIVLPVETGSIMVTAFTLPRVTSTTLIRDEGMPSNNAMLATNASSRKSSKAISSFIETDTVGVMTNLYQLYCPPRKVTVKVRFWGLRAEAPAWSSRVG
jgi:hypothetical protein